MLFVASAMAAEQWSIFETFYTKPKKHANPVIDVEVNVVFQHGGRQWIVPAFWAGEGKWTVRFAPPLLGEYQYRVEFGQSQ